MSICRWSSDDQQCDLYIYEDVNGGITCHVAANHPVFSGPLPQKVYDETNWNESEESIREFLARDREVSELIKRYDPIGLPYDGCVYNVDTYSELFDLVFYLHMEGYHVPTYVFDIINEEMEDDE